jgi:hypothetical protein
MVVLTQVVYDVVICGAFSNEPAEFRGFPVPVLPENQNVETNDSSDAFVDGFKSLGKQLILCVKAGIYAAPKMLASGHESLSALIQQIC